MHKVLTVSLGILLILSIVGGVYFYNQVGGKLETTLAELTESDLKVQDLVGSLVKRGEEVSRLSYEKSQLSQENYSLVVERNSLRVEKDNLTNQTADLRKDLENLRKFYPPKYFRDYNELRSWLDTGPIGTIGDSWEGHLRAQRIALDSGYIWSVVLDRDTGEYVSCIIAGDSVYWVFGSGAIEWIGWR